MGHAHIMQSGSLPPELITYARLISSEASMVNQDVSELSKKKYLCLLGFPQTTKDTKNDQNIVDDH